MATNPRLVLHETKHRPHTTRDAAELSGVSTDAIRSQVADLNDRIKALLGYTRSPIEVDGAGTWRVDGVAGLLRLNDRVEIEVVPKFFDPADDNWRADFFLLAVLVRTGHLLVADEVAAGIEDRGDLATLVARALLRCTVRISVGLSVATNVFLVRTSLLTAMWIGTLSFCPSRTDLGSRGWN